MLRALRELRALLRAPLPPPLAALGCHLQPGCQLHALPSLLGCDLSWGPLLSCQRELAAPGSLVEMLPPR